MAIREKDIARCARMKQWQQDFRDDGKEIRLKVADGQMRMKVREYRGLNPLKHLREPPEYARQVDAMRNHLEERVGYASHRPVEAWAVIQLLSERIACSGAALDRLDRGHDAQSVRDGLSSDFKMAFGRPLTFLD